LFPVSLLLAVGMIFACVSSVLSADRHKARNGRRLSLLAVVVVASVAGAAVFMPGASRFAQGAAVGLLGFAATVGVSTWLNLRREWSFHRLFLRAFFPGLLLSLAAAGAWQLSTVSGAAP
jgi:hypothetical protein